MLVFMKRHRLWPPLVLALLSLGVALFAGLAIAQTPAYLQYLWPAPAPVTTTTEDGQSQTDNSGLTDARLGMDALAEQLTGVCEPITLFAVMDGVSVIADQDNAQAATARLVALEDGAYPVMPLLLKTGRLIYPDEFLYGNKVVMLEEKLAVALFGYAEPLDRSILLDGEKYRVVGIISHTRNVGEHQEYSLYIPYRKAERSGLAMTALCIQAMPVQGAGGWAAFESAMGGLGKQGTAISLGKEGMNAALPFRAAGCAFGLLALLFCLRWLNRQVMRLYRDYARRLRDQYAMRLLPWMLARVLPLLLGYAASVLLFAQLFIVFIAPVYTFPEWIPKVLVEPNDIAAAFWDVWQRQAIVLEVRSPELQRLRFFAVLMGWACGAMALSGGLLAARLGAALRSGDAADEASLLEADAPTQAEERGERFR